MTFGFHRPTQLRLAICGVFALCGSSELLAQGSGCAAVFAAQNKLLKTPHHEYFVDSSSTDTRVRKETSMTSESIVTANGLYTLYEGKWMVSRSSIAELQRMQAESNRTSKSTCSVVGSESINGEAATDYHVHSVTEGGVSDSHEWISKNRGLPLRTVTLLDVGGALGKSTIVQRYDYSNLALPAGVK